MKNSRLLVVGSLNVDHTFRVPRLPGPGETMTARGASTCFGGKGANQALAAARAGGEVRLIGCVGEDEHGVRYRDYLAAEGIDVTGVVTTEEAPTGAAFIAVDDGGENSIVVNPGANHALSEAHLEGLIALFEDVTCVLLQLECRLPVVKRASELARGAGTEVILNPSPWLEAIGEGGLRAEVVIANEFEARALTGREEIGLSRAEDPESLLAGVGCELLIVTRGARSTLVVSAKEGLLEITPPSVRPVDTVGAGDVFAGVFGVAHSEGVAVHEAIEFANHAAALATLRPGAQDAIPTREEIRESRRGCGN